ncbi:MAG: terminase TerL endonuclease subunit, partial [Candidatus Methylomirabilales bacterium]
GEMFPISNAVDGLQGLDPSVAICDEMGFMPVGSWDSLLLASGKRPRSLVVGIGTPGLDRDNALWQLRARWLGGEATPGFHFTEYAATEACAVDDEEQWKLANPALRAGYQSLGALRTARSLSEEGPFRVFRLGQWVDGVECWLGRDGGALWDGLAQPYIFGPGPVWVGVDAARTRDSTAVAAIQRRPDGRLHATVRIWVPRKDEPTDPVAVMAHIRALYRAHALEAVSYDPKFFDLSAVMLADEGLPMIEVPQSVERMTPAVMSTYEALKRGEITHDGDSVVRAQVLNAVPRLNEQGFTLSKRNSRGRIDAAVAICLAVDRALRTERPRQVAVW